MSDFSTGCITAANTIIGWLHRNGHHDIAAKVTTAWNDGSIVATLAPAPADPTALAPTPAPAEFARSQGYTGDQCTHCNSMRMKTAGHCMVCEDCGTTTGCS